MIGGLATEAESPAPSSIATSDEAELPDVCEEIMRVTLLPVIVHNSIYLQLDSMILRYN